MFTHLFLHMGPGCHSQVESEFLTSKYPNVDFWDQPKITEPENSFSLLVGAVRGKINEMSEASQAPISVVGHSFGGVLAYEALKKCSQQIESLVLISTGFDFRYSTLNFLKELMESPETSGEMKEKMNHFISHKKPLEVGADFWEMAGLVMQHPQFLQSYWPKQSDFEKFVEVASQYPAMDEVTFANTFNDLLNNELIKPTLSPFKGPVKLVLGEKDPLIDVNYEKKL